MPLSSWLSHPNGRQLAQVAMQLVETLRTHGPAALPPLPPSAPRRPPQTHSIARHAFADPTQSRSGRRRRRGPHG